MIIVNNLLSFFLKNLCTSPISNSSGLWVLTAHQGILFLKILSNLLLLKLKFSLIDCEYFKLPIYLTLLKFNSFKKPSDSIFDAREILKLL